MKSRALGMVRTHFIPVIILIFLGVPCLVMIALTGRYHSTRRCLRRL